LCKSRKDCSCEKQEEEKGKNFFHGLLGKWEAFGLLI
jgi:hypothetical protein